jgi:hypothetical protein
MVTMRKNILHKSLSLVVLLAATMMFISCKSRTATTELEALSVDSLTRELIASDVREVVYPLPSPFEITAMLNDIGARYNVDILNPTSNEDKYFTEQSKAINLGVYGADLTYASSYEQQQDIQIYLNTIHSLANDLGINVDYAMLLSDEYKEKLNDKDSLVSIVTSTFYDTYEYLARNSNPDLSVSMVAGMWVELMYIATHISEDSYNFTGVVDLIVNQKTSYEKVMDLLYIRNSNPEISELEATLAVLRPVYARAESGLGEEDYELIINTIRNLRESITS